MGLLHLTPFEGGRIDALHKENYSIRAIAKKLGRSPSTISRELSRFKGYFYDAEAAQDQYVQLRKNSGSKGKATEELKSLIVDKLKATWSPEQIVGRHLSGQISVKTVYLWIYKGILGVDLEVLRHKGKSRKPAENRGKFITGKSIHERSEKINNREEFGHWEGDSMLSSRGKSKECLSTFSERKSRLFLALKKSDRKASSMEKNIKRLKGLVGDSLKTLTVDRGKEFACYKSIEDMLDIEMYFADPYSAWQRGRDENSNGLLREFFPKKTDFSKVSEEELFDALLKINNRPRKCLGWRTPTRVFQHEVLQLT